MTTAVRSRDPFSASLTYEIDDDRLVLTVDEDLAAVATERQLPADE